MASPFHLPVAVLGLAMTACATMHDPGTPAPVGVVSAPVGFPAPGARWVLRETSRNETTGESTMRSLVWVALGVGTHSDRPAFRLSDGSHVHVFDAATYGTLALLDHKGAEIIAYEPHEGQIASPLWVGKSWGARSNWHNRTDGTTLYDVNVVWTVIAHENVDVPAGSVKTFRVEAWPDTRDSIRKRTYWYAPDLKIVVKQTIEGSFGGEDRLTMTSELMAFKAEGNVADEVVRAKARAAIESFILLAPDPAAVFTAALFDLDTPLPTIERFAQLSDVAATALGTLIDLARNDLDPKIRTAAVAGIKILAVEDSSADVRSAAQRALAELAPR